jgi:small subunit ribosomal protein S4
MGQPRRTRKKYSTPRHPWQSARIEEEKGLVKDYGVKNKKEIWKMAAVLRRLSTQAKRLVVDISAQGSVERENLLSRLRSYGLISGNDSTDAILSLTVRDVMDRRLQTLVQKKGLANTVKQARQFITHKHITVGGKKVSSPSYLVTLEEEPTITFTSESMLAQKKFDEPPRKPTTVVEEVETKDESKVSEEATEKTVKASKGKEEVSKTEQKEADKTAEEVAKE